MWFINRLTLLAFFMAVLSAVVQGISIPAVNEADKAPSLFKNGIESIDNSCVFVNATQGSARGDAEFGSCWEAGYRAKEKSNIFTFGSCSGMKELVQDPGQDNFGCSFGMEAIDPTCKTNAAFITATDIYDVIRKVIWDLHLLKEQGRVAVEGYLLCPDGKSPMSLIESKFEIYDTIN